MVPFIALALFLAFIIAAINHLGRRLEKHDDWLKNVDVRVENLHKDRERAHARSLQVKREPPPLSEAPTIEVSADMLVTLRNKARKETDGDKPK